MCYQEMVTKYRDEQAHIIRRLTPDILGNSRDIVGTIPKSQPTRNFLYILYR